MPPPPPPPPGYGGQSSIPPAPPGYGTPPPGYGTPPGSPTYAAGPGFPNYAGIGARFLGLLIDGLVGVLFGIPALIAVRFGPRHWVSCTVDGEPGLCHVPTAGSWAIIIALGIAGFALYVYFYTRLMGRDGATWGQRALSIRTVDATTGQPIGQGRAVGRFFAMYLSNLVCYLGWLWALWDRQRQTWHDKLVSSIVVKA
jgi:uncharacterized RDD family membrane protein YckC